MSEGRDDVVVDGVSDVSGDGDATGGKAAGAEGEREDRAAAANGTMEG